MAPLVRSVFLIYTVREQENPISCLQGLARCHEKALWSLRLPRDPILSPPPFCDLTCTFQLQGVPLSPGNPIALGSHRLPITENSCSFGCEALPDVLESRTRLLVRVLLSFEFVFWFVQLHEKARLWQLQS